MRPKPSKTNSKFKKKFELFRKRSSASECVRMHPNASQQVRMDPNGSERIREPRKTCDHLEKTGENFEKLRDFFFTKTFFTTQYLLILLYVLAIARTADRTLIRTGLDRFWPTHMTHMTHGTDPFGRMVGPFCRTVRPFGRTVRPFGRTVGLFG